MHFKMALIQMRVVGGERSRNLSRAEAMIAEAAAHGSRLVLLPEAMDLGWTHPASRSESEPIPEGAASRSLMRAASHHDIYVCAGLTERAGERVFNSAILVGNDGRLLSLHRKIHELEIGHPYYALGDRLSVVSTELGTLGVMICADGFAKDQVISRTLGYMGADVILSPSAWAVPHDHDNGKEPYGALWKSVYGPVAEDFRIWIVGASNVGAIEAGPWAGRKCIGCSLAVGPDGKAVLQGPYGVDAETILYLDVETRERPARGCGWTDYWGTGETRDSGNGRGASGP